MNLHMRGRVGHVTKTEKSLLPTERSFISVKMMVHALHRLLQQHKVGQKRIEATFNHIVIISQAHITFLQYQEHLISLQKIAISVPPCEEMTVFSAPKI